MFKLLKTLLIIGALLYGGYYLYTNVLAPAIDDKQDMGEEPSDEDAPEEDNFFDDK